MKAHWLILTAALLVFGFGSYVFRNDIRDDTYITLRYSDNLLKFGIVEYNFGEPSYGCSAPGYMVILSVLERMVGRENMPKTAKIFTILCHLASLLAVYFALLRLGNTKNAFLFLLLILFVFLSPSAFRWQQDGMETSLLVLVACLLAIILFAFSSISNLNKPLLYLLGSLTCSFGIFIRPDFVLVCLPAILFFFSRSSDRGTALVLMCVAPLVLFYSYFGSVLPDTAIAKSLGFQGLGWIKSAFEALLTVNPGLIILPIVGLIFMRNKYFFILSIFPLFALILLGLLRGQIIHGARYFIVPLTFCSVSICLGCFKEIGVKSMVLVMAISITHTVIIAPFVYKAAQKPFFDFGGISPEDVVLADDIGQIGWFTRCRIIDHAGLVHGPAIAKLRGIQRLERTMQKVGRPSIAVLRDDTYREVYPFLKQKWPSFKPGGIIMHNNNFSKVVTRRIFWLSEVAK